MQLGKEKILVNLYCEKKAALFVTENTKLTSNIYIATK